MKLCNAILLSLLAVAACKKDEGKDSKTEATEPKAPEKTEAAEKAETATPPETKRPETETETSGIKGEEVSYQVGELTMKGYVAWDPAVEGKRPGVIVAHEWWGHTDYARKRAEMLAELGYTALALDMYGDGKTADHPKDAQAFMKTVTSDFEVTKARFLAAKKLLEEHETVNPEKLAAIGYCMGGSIVLNMAREGIGLTAVAAFHAGSISPAVEAKKDTFPKMVMVFQGADDPFFPKEQAEAFTKEMEALGVTPTFENYPGAVHAFTNPGATEMGKKFELPLAYDEAADKDSWEKMKTGLAEAFADAD